MSTEISFSINGAEHVVPPTFPASMSLNDYLRDVAGLKGTKVMCREAGCGCCSVTISHCSPDSDKLETHSVQSCLTPLYAVDGWQITTVEGIGSEKSGFHPIQERIAKFNGTQCGYCTPGMVMNMYGLLHQNPNITAQEVEDSFDGNLCRCTGYRSILDAMKSFSGDANIPGAKNIDIEDLNKHLCPKTGKACAGSHLENGGTRGLDLQINASNAKWCRPTTLDELGTILRTNKNRKVKLFFGNTSYGIFKDDGPFDIYIDLHGVKSNYSYEVKSESIRFGAATTLTTFITRLKDNCDKRGFEYFTAVAKHLKFVANVMVRNAGCIAGNLMIKHKHPDFPSDIFTLLEAVGAKVEVYDSATSQSPVYPLMDFLRKMNMVGKLITAVELPRFTDKDMFRSFKITPRAQNSHAYVNAAFKVAVLKRKIQGKPSLVYGGINAAIVHANATEAYLENKTLTDGVVKEALRVLKKELIPDRNTTWASAKYRQDVAGNLLYKALLGIYNPENAKLRSGSDNLQRPISSGMQTYQEMKSEFPLKEALPKKTAPLQASGEAQYINDIPTFQQELFGVFVLSEQGSADIESVDASEALKMPGVVKFICAKDIPEGGTNNHMCSLGMMGFNPHELFASKEIFFAGQSVGMVLAESRLQATDAAKLVEVKYSNIRTPILTIEESIAQGKELPFPQKQIVLGDPESAFKSVDKVLEGECRMGSQYHFFLETHVSLAVPSEDGIDLYSATQLANMNQIVASGVIGKPMNYVNVNVPRIGGGFGGKISDSCSTSAAATLAAYVTGRPVRVSMDLSTNMQICGKRAPIKTTYKIGYMASGDVQVIDMDFYLDTGHAGHSLGDVLFIMQHIDMGYHVPSWNIRMHPMFTNKQSMSATRAPGSVPAAFIIETIMEHVAKVVNIHPILLKEINLYEKDQYDMYGQELTHCTMREVWTRLKDLAEVEGRMRQVNAFNQENLWKKRGITMTSCKYGINYFGAGFTANVSIFGHDGSVAVSQGGVEMGQGLYMKVAQGVARVLGVPLENIKVRPNQNLISPNSWVTGGSVSSELCTQAAIEASNILKERLAPIREKMPDADWKTLIQMAAMSGINLSVKHSNKTEMPKGHCHYSTYCAAVIETEVDILTGESQIRRVDFMADFGESLNPTIDIGQIEGAFVMGLGCFLSEDIVFDEKNGKILNDGTWEYKPPTSKDIPIDWRVHILPDTPNPLGMLSSKAVGEPPVSLSVGALLANKLAVEAARRDLFGADDFVPAVAPLTVERAQQSVGLNFEQLSL